MKVGLVVPHFGINATKENLINFIQIAKKKILNHFGYMIECYMRLILNSRIYERQINENGLRILRTILDPLTTLAFIDLFYDSSVVNLVNDL